MALSNLITPTLDELTDLAVAFYANLIPEDDVSRMSDQWKRVRSLTMLLRDLHEYLKRVDRDALPDSAVKQALDRWGVILEVLRKGPTVALGANALRVRGNIGASVLTSYTLTHSSKRYQVAEFATIPAAGYVDVDVASIDPGPDALLTVGDTLEFEEAYPGLETSAAIVVDLSGGDDSEQDGPYRERILAILRRPGLGGTEADWIRWGLAVAGVAEIFVYPNRDGLGTTDIAGMHSASGSVRALTTGERTILSVALAARRPVVMVPRVLETVAESAGVQVLLQPMPDQTLRPDWIDPGGITVSAWNATTRVLTLSAARPVSMAPQGRLVVKTAGAEVVTIEALGPGANDIKIATPIPSGWAPAGTEAVYPAGPLTKPTRDALVAWIDSLGPVVGVYGMSWKGALYLQDVSGIVGSIDGVLDSTIQTTAGGAFVTVTPTEYIYPDDGKVGFLVAGMILVRYA